MSQKRNKQAAESALRDAAPDPPRLSAERSRLILLDALAAAESSCFAETKRAARAKRILASRIRFAACTISGLAAMVAVALITATPQRGHIPSVDTERYSAVSDPARTAGVTGVTDPSVVLTGGHTTASTQIGDANDTGMPLASVVPALKLATHSIRRRRHWHGHRLDLATDERPDRSLPSSVDPASLPGRASALDTTDSITMSRPLMVVVTKPVPRLTVMVTRDSPEDEEGYARSSSLRIDEETGRRVWVQCAMVSGDETSYIALRSDTPSVGEAIGVSQHTPASAVVTGALNGLSDGNRNGTLEGDNPL